MFIDYGVSDNCCNPDSYGCVCVKCGMCGRGFEQGVMVKESVSIAPMEVVITKKKWWNGMVSEVVVCPTCGGLINGDTYCRHCGQRLMDR